MGTTDLNVTINIFCISEQLDLSAISKTVLWATTNGFPFILIQQFLPHIFLFPFAKLGIFNDSDGISYS